MPSSTIVSLIGRHSVVARALAAAFLAGVFAISGAGHAAGEVGAGSAKADNSAESQSTAAKAGDSGDHPTPADPETCCCMSEMGYGCKVAGDPGCKYSREEVGNCKAFMYGCVASSHCGD